MIVKLDLKQIEVNKLPIGKYADLIRVFKTLPEKIKFNELSTLKNSELIKLAPDLIADNLPEAINIIHIGTGLPVEEIEQLGLNECIDLILAIIEVNQYAAVYEKLKKAIARPQAIPTKQIGSQG